MKYFITISFLSCLLFANESNVDFYNASEKNELLCKISTNSYAIISKKNSSMILINNNEFFKLNDQNQYISSSGCHSINKHGAGIIF